MNTITVDEYHKLTGQSKWSRATATYACLKCGQSQAIIWKGAKRECAVCKTPARRFPSKTEARVYGRLVKDYGAENVYCQVRFPLLSIARTDAGIPMYFTLDFIVTAHPLASKLYMDAKSGTRRSRDWARGRAAFEKMMGCKVQEISQ